MRKRLLLIELLILKQKKNERNLRGLTPSISLMVEKEEIKKKKKSDKENKTSKKKKVVSPVLDKELFVAINVLRITILRIIKHQNLYVLNAKIDN
ncbi:hypothetical protein BpHYR1_053903 [Brachionus plicatilis]|uniref:Uncharacterized protein n=1 Tax=Brachionus plicatilis TaxID=10195 RepID=A0A3M7R0V4_BRAPC|nr:hypothetical protein BpHYR1_053903 [Brachionus plicatilis]